MLVITCPNCGDRPELEFRCGGEAHIARPQTPAELDDGQWGAFLFTRTNPKGVHAERWIHQHGCGRWFNALRDTVSDRLIATYPMGTPRPDAGAAATPSSPASSTSQP
ncbi:sarcosine oxidase subunit delta [Aurantimonas sp. MSK8Z-1]|uniref:sarcosine oxidase subunit delta n=1 Tax=Mangrovibrevibacter kandeliae TaxID=2968473 RepID=UPI002118B64B|nr:sarcosine oxidase subunit delta [Aurantimonas sp. MSK8Z-1]MCW4113547.1 sarcosine oxidase subunit delta [Aurantimonas sp. MSK8Z-1]